MRRQRNSQPSGRKPDSGSSPTHPTVSRWATFGGPAIRRDSHCKPQPMTNSLSFVTDSVAGGAFYFLLARQPLGNCVTSFPVLTLYSGHSGPAKAAAGLTQPTFRVALMYALCIFSTNAQADSQFRFCIHAVVILCSGICIFGSCACSGVLPSGRRPSLQRHRGKLERYRKFISSQQRLSYAPTGALDVFFRSSRSSSFIAFQMHQPNSLCILR